MQPTAHTKAGLPSATYYILLTLKRAFAVQPVTYYCYNTKAGIHMHAVQPTVNTEAGLPGAYTKTPKRPISRNVVAALLGCFINISCNKSSTVKPQP